MLEELKENPIYVWINGVVMWRRPVESGLYCGILNLFFFLIVIGDYSFITLSSYLFLSFLILCALYVHTNLFKATFFESKAEVKNPLQEFASTPIQISAEDVEQHVKSVVLLVNTSLNFLRRVYTLEDRLLSLTVGIVLLIASWIGQLFTTAFLFQLLTIYAFAWPFLYSKHHEKIDALWEKAAKPIRPIFKTLGGFLKPKNKTE